MWEQSVPSLLSLCVDTVARDIDCHRPNVKTLPYSLKCRFLQLLSRRGGLVSDNLDVLLHDGVRELDLSESVVSDDSLKAAHICKSLHRLDLNDARQQQRQISSKELISLFPCMPRLRILHIRRCDAVNDAVIESVAKNCPMLKEIDIGGCVRISDKSLQFIGMYTRFLACASLSHTKITDEGILALTNGECTKVLSELRLDGCQGITDLSIEAISQLCPHIKILIFHGCPSVTDKARLAIDEIWMNFKVKQLTWTVF